ncbi:REn [Chilli leaf curl Vellanad virus [India/Vellanad/2008]]|uniref:Replication enhancer n=1 Tax=Chilli leaf curl Vellanad virus TaxID=2050929 RepID=H6SSU8_9GEMI|nr:REn [Chilli leaf curl Vellanad virus [India/Vellanad/2008]]AEA76860.1 REn [Chilli leaf curl Vellanad virus [India/Vellanad/2008]]
MDSRTGERITAALATNGVYIWQVPNPLYFTILNHDSRPFNSTTDLISLRVQFNHNLRRVLGIHKCFLTFRIWTTLQPRTGHFLRVFKTQLLRYLDSLGVVSVNNVIRGVDHVLWNVLTGTVSVQQFSEIKYNVY